MCRLPLLGSPKAFQVHSLELANRVLLKDFQHFTDRRHFLSDEVSDEFLSNLSGAQWETVRALMSPAFRSGKIEDMFELIEIKSHTLVDYLIEKSSKKFRFLDMENIIKKYNIDTIGSTVFGIDTNLLLGENTGLGIAVENLLNKGILKDYWSFKLVNKFPYICRKIGINSWYSYVVDAVRNLIAERPRSEREHEDFIDFMLNAKEKSGDSGQLM